jgi:hypothetical protein
MHRTWRRLRRIMGVPSTLVLAAVSAFYLLINAITWQMAKSDGEIGVWAATGAVIVLTVLLLLRYHRQVAAALAPSLDRPGSDKLTDRRGAIVIVGLDSAEPGTTFLRLLATATKLEYVALVTTPQAVMRGVVTTLEAQIQRAPQAFPHQQIRLWDRVNAQTMADTEQAVTEAITWMLRHGLHPSQIVVDVTKGRRPMQFGALIAAERARIEVQYLAAEWHHLDDRPLPGSAEFTVVHTHWATAAADAESIPG